MLHGLVHKIELHLVVVITIAIIVVHIELRMRTLSHYLLCKVELIHLLIN